MMQYRSETWNMRKGNLLCNGVSLTHDEINETERNKWIKLTPWKRVLMLKMTKLRIKSITFWSERKILDEIRDKKTDTGNADQQRIVYSKPQRGNENTHQTQ